MMARVLPLTSTPTNLFLSHLPAFKLAHASGTFLARDISRAMVCSAAAPIFPAGELTTMMPDFVAALTSTLSTPTPALATTFKLLPAASSSAVTFVSDRTSRASYSGMISKSLPADKPLRSSTSKVFRSRARPSGDSFSGLRTFGRVEPFRRGIVSVGTGRSVKKAKDSGW